jgi:hypothetical protein
MTTNTTNLRSDEKLIAKETAAIQEEVHLLQNKIAGLNKEAVQEIVTLSKKEEDMAIDKIRSEINN